MNQIFKAFIYITADYKRLLKSDARRKRGYVHAEISTVGKRQKE